MVGRGPVSVARLQVGGSRMVRERYDPFTVRLGMVCGISGVG